MASSHYLRATKGRLEKKRSSLPFETLNYYRDYAVTFSLVEANL